MKIQLDRQYHIVHDKLNWVLMFQPDGVNEKTQKPFGETDLGYFPNIPTALRSYVEYKIKDNEGVLEVQEVLAQIKEIYDSLQNLSIVEEAKNVF